MMALLQDNTDVITYLLQRGADATLRFGFTMLINNM